MNISKLKQLLGMTFLNSGVAILFVPLVRFLLRTAYTVQFASWYMRNSLRTHLLLTEHSFGYGNRYILYEYLVNSHELEDKNITYLEFGVASGGSMKWWVEKNKNPKSCFVGFDTFSGLPEDWGNIPKGTFSTGGAIPDIKNERIRYEIGLFQKTLPNYLKAYNPSGAQTVIHIDCDLYSAALFVLIMLSPFLKKGDILIFDEFADVMNEFRAYLDFLAATNINLTLIKAVNAGHKVAFRVSD